MDPAFAPFLEFEVFDDVGDVYGGSIDAGLAQGAIEELACGTNKGKTLEIFFVTGLFANEHHAGGTRPKARHGLSSMQIEITGFAPVHGGLKCRERSGSGPDHLPGLSCNCRTNAAGGNTNPGGAKRRSALSSWC
jgi:hypothetical protein